MKNESKYIGCMLNAAVGDALGKQNEGRRRSEISVQAKDYGSAPSGSPGEKLGKGQYTDDTEQMLVLAESIIECNGFDVEDFAKRIARWGADALLDPARKSLLGPSSAKAIARLNSGVSWKESGSDIPSCGSAVRVPPVGLFYANMEEIESNAALSSIPTHNTGSAIAGAVAVAVGVRCAIEDMELFEIMKETCIRTSKYDLELGKKIRFAFENMNEEPHEMFTRLGTSYSVYEVVPSAFYCFSRHVENAKSAVIEAVNAGGDTDSIACVTGALCGALHGFAPLPKRWIKGLENRERVRRTARIIFEKSAACGRI